MTAGKKPHKRATEERILDECLSLAEEQGWSNVRLRLVADRLGLSLAEIHGHYHDMNAVANAWFAKALEAMLSNKRSNMSKLPPPERLHRSMACWLDSLAVHRRVTVQMIAEKMHPPHVHHWVPLIFNLSRLIHWWLDAAAIASTGRQRQVEEIGLSAIFLSTFGFWARDDSAGQEKTKRFLTNRLHTADNLMAKMFPPRQHPQ